LIIKLFTVMPRTGRYRLVGMWRHSSWKTCGTGDATTAGHDGRRKYLDRI